MGILYDLMTKANPHYLYSMTDFLVAGLMLICMLAAPVLLVIVIKLTLQSPE